MKFKLLICRLLIYFKGIRFYKTDVEAKSREFTRVEIDVINNKNISFYFYEDEYDDFVFRRGIIENVRFKSHTIQAVFHEDLPKKLIKYNNLKIVFRSDDLSFVSREIIAKVLLDIFLDFLRKEISISK